MKLSKRVVELLEGFVTKGPKEIDAVVLDSARQQGYILGTTAEAGDPGVTLTLADYDRYSIALRNLQVSYDNLPENGRHAEDYLRQHAEQVTRRLTYLEEPLALVELDGEAGVAQLRSNPPYQDGDDLVYWEALLRAAPHPSVSLSRYRWRPGFREHESLVYPATFAMLGRIAQDLAVSLSAENK